MYAKIIRFESKTKNIKEIESLFENSLVPEMRNHNGYEGCYFLQSSSHRGLAITLWEDKDALEASNQNQAFQNLLQSINESLSTEVSFTSYQVSYADHQTSY
ncbi:MAG: hypothetical protein FI734_07845 [SAR202 cluster bacterium]|nr:hypothetical protein [SAR202 cluster bacterium]|tara:strand:- start:3398 stop:3703 length:306 start_codon:yes stop_codon:yes gene_type:complete